MPLVSVSFRHEHCRGSRRLGGAHPGRPLPLGDLGPETPEDAPLRCGCLCYIRELFSDEVRSCLPACPTHSCWEPPTRAWSADCLPVIGDVTALGVTVRATVDGVQPSSDAGDSCRRPASRWESGDPSRAAQCCATCEVPGILRLQHRPHKPDGDEKPQPPTDRGRTQLDDESSAPTPSTARCPGLTFDEPYRRHWPRATRGGTSLYHAGHPALMRAT